MEKITVAILCFLVPSNLMTLASKISTYSVQKDLKQVTAIVLFLRKMVKSFNKMKEPLNR